jgi:DNA-3-methyladenine glycosylase
VPTAVLLRALEPTEGLAVMRANRAGRIPAARLKPTDLCSGPAKLAQAMAIDRALDHEDLTRSERLWLERGAVIDAGRVVATARVGVGYAQEWAEAPLRFYVADSPHVSRR